MGLFDGYTRIESQLLRLYTQSYARTRPLDTAKELAKECLDAAIEESKKQGTYNLPPDLGDLLLEKEKTDEETRYWLAKKRAEGVRDEDIRWWGNMHDVERWMLLKVDDHARMVSYIAALERGDSRDQAALVVRRFYPMFGDPSDTTHGTGEDRPLPHELKDRINIYIETRFNDPEQFKAEMLSSSSFNATVRKEIRAGRL